MACNLKFGFILILINSFTKISVGKDIIVIGLQENGTISSESLASFEYEARVKEDSSLCVRVNFFGLRPFVPIFVACELGSGEKCIRLEYVEGEIIWIDYNIQMQGQVMDKVQSKKWNLICLTKALLKVTNKLRYDLYFNGEEIHRQYVPLSSFHSGRKSFKVYFGQTTSDPTYNDGLRSFSGQIGSFILIQSALTGSDVLNKYECKENYLEGDLLQEFKNEIKLTNAEKKTIDSHDFCIKGNNLFYIPFLKKRSFEESLILCQTLGGKISRPITQRENKRLSNIAKRYNNSCIDKGDNLGRLIWLGMDKRQGTWIDPMTEGKIKYFNWRSGHIQQNCAYLKFNETDSEDDGFAWETTYCSDALPLNLCTICEFSREISPALKVRLGGMCKKSGFETEYFLTEPESDRRFNLKGQTTSLIQWDPLISTWKLTKPAFKGGEARLLSQNPYPMGRQKWKIIDIPCYGISSNKEILLSLSVCKENEFSCDDGTCVLIKGRCDKTRDCLDGSDENNCFPVIIPKKYNKRISPSTRNNVVSGNKIKIELTWFIDQLTDFNGISFTMTFHYNLTWRDYRLKFQNLIDGDKSLNFIENNGGLWYPKILIPLVKEYQDFKSVFMFERNSKPVLDRSGPRENLIYEGVDTPITSIQTGRAVFFCDFSFVYFPYDHHFCNINIIVTQSSEQILHLLGSNVSYFPLYTSSDYIISDAHFISYNTSRVYTEVTMQIHIYKTWSRPILLFYINPLFVSSFAYTTLWLEIDEILLRLFIVFNCIFISFAVLHSSMPSIPSTLYLKIVDIWNMYFLLINLSILAVHIFIHIYRKRDIKVNLRKVDPIYFSPMESRDIIATESMKRKGQHRYTKPSGAYMARKLNNGCRTLIVIVTAFFISINIFLILFHVISS